MLEIDTAPILAELNDRQKEAVQATDGPVLVVAGPGSGKTRVLTCRIAWLLATQEALPYQVLALTFTNKAAQEMRERVQKLLPEGMTKGMWVGTFHALMARLLRAEATHLGFTSDFAIYDPDDAERIIKRMIEEYDYDVKVIKPRVIRNHISDAKNVRKSAEQMKLSARSRQAEVAAQLYDPYNAALRTANAFDFDDLLLKPLELFDQNPEILQKYQRKWSHVLIDEYQDTNHVQYLLAYALSEIHRNLCVVGDDAQSIYSFRGADIQNIFSFERDFKEAKVVRLEQNYRSTSAILTAADAVISNNTEQIKKTLWTENESGQPISIVESSNDREEANRAARTIRRECLSNGLRWQDCAILYRTNVQSRTFEEALRKGGIPYRIIGGISFYQRKEIKDAIAYLRLLVNPNDISSFQRVVNYPSRGIGVKSQQKITEHAFQEGYDLSRTLREIEDLSIPPRARGALKRFVDLIETHAADAISGKAVSDIATSLFRESGLFNELSLDDTPTGQNRIENLNELLRAIQDYAPEDDSPTLSSYLQSVTLMTDADTDEPNLDRVVLMTLHASKGLEFPVVFIGGLEEKLLPLYHGEEDIDPKSLEEERRLLYVGITRAESRLYLGWARVRSRYGRAEYSQPSRFIQELIPKGSGNHGKPSKWRTKSGYSKPISESNHKKLGGFERINSERKRTSNPAGSGYSRMPKQNPIPKIHTGFKIGTRVRHKKYGLGEVVMVEGYRGDTIVTVHFDQYGSKRLAVSFSPMEVIEP
ncbi:MAG: UvrD-helicase domain-containing protein [Bacteroidetes bacterium]|nr:UvrD-helicase domain-containing protein [Bacteroidota bacterium]MCY4206067.1 UvrD-helicase domain-containing protein [Bacteroidota bacterium]